MLESGHYVVPRNIDQIMQHNRMIMTPTEDLTLPRQHDKSMSCELPSPCVEQNTIGCAPQDRHSLAEVSETVDASEKFQHFSEIVCFFK